MTLLSGHYDTFLFRFLVANCRPLGFGLRGWHPRRDPFFLLGLDVNIFGMGLIMVGFVMELMAAMFFNVPVFL